MPSNCINETTPEWTIVNTLMKEKYKSNLTIVAWIHSHVGRNPHRCSFTGTDIHTQKAWSAKYPEILGLVIHVGDDGSIMKYDFYGITGQGYENMSHCKRSPLYCNCYSYTYRDPYKRLNYKSFLEFVKFTEGPLEVLQIEVDDPREVPVEEQPIPKKPRLISSEYAFVNNKVISSIDFSCQHSQHSTKIIVKVLKKLSMDTYLIGDSTGTCKLKLTEAFTMMEEEKSYKILFKDTIPDERCIIISDETDISELYKVKVTVPFGVAMKIDTKISTSKVRLFKID